VEGQASVNTGGGAVGARSAEGQASVSMAQNEMTRIIIAKLICTATFINSLSFKLAHVHQNHLM
jgi:hypothetical protein